jgi:hypothetical protein
MNQPLPTDAAQMLQGGDVDTRRAYIAELSDVQLSTALRSGIDSPYKTAVLDVLPAARARAVLGDKGGQELKDLLPLLATARQAEILGITEGRLHELLDANQRLSEAVAVIEQLVACPRAADRQKLAGLPHSAAVDFAQLLEIEANAEAACLLLGSADARMEAIEAVLDRSSGARDVEMNIYRRQLKAEHVALDNQYQDWRDSPKVGTMSDGELAEWQARHEAMEASRAEAKMHAERLRRYNQIVVRSKQIPRRRFVREMVIATGAFAVGLIVGWWADGWIDDLVGAGWVRTALTRVLVPTIVFGACDLWLWRTKVEPALMRPMKLRVVEQLRAVADGDLRRVVRSD